MCPEIKVEGSVKLHYDGKEIELTTGDHKISDIRLKSGVTPIGVSGIGSVVFKYKEADI